MTIDIKLVFVIVTRISYNARVFFFNPTGQLKRRIKMMKELTMAALVAGATGMTKADAWDKTFPKSDKVEHCKATFKNRFGITLAADVYKPKEGNGELGMGNGKLAAIAVSGPFGAVKEHISEWSCGFSYFLQFKSQFGNKEFMI